METMTTEEVVVVVAVVTTETASGDVNDSGIAPEAQPDPPAFKFPALSGPLYGFVSPPIILFTIVTNSLVCIVLLKRHMRSSTNVILIAMAVSDTLTGLFPLPCYVFFFTLGAWREHVPYEWCLAYACLTNHIPTIFHSVSVWLTVGLAGHRYMCVCHSLAAKKWCTMANVAKVVA